MAFVSSGSGTQGDGSGLLMVYDFVPSDAATVAGARMFVGLALAAASTDVEPNTLTNSIGVAQLSTNSTQFYLIAAGSSAQAATAMGVGVGSPSGLSTNLFRLYIYSPSSQTATWYVELVNLVTGVSSGVFTKTGAGTVVPQASTLLAPKAWRSNNATALAVGIDIAGLYVLGAT